MIIPLEEGKTHINAYTKSSTELGRMLSNICDISVTVNNIKYRTLEGYWYYLLMTKLYGDLTNDKEIMNVFTNLSGFEVKSFIKNIRISKDELLIMNNYKNEDEFKNKICEAIKLKIEQNSKLKELFIKNTLPYSHYYYYGDITNCKVVNLTEYEWIVEYINNLKF